MDDHPRPSGISRVFRPPSSTLANGSVAAGAPKGAPAKEPGWGWLEWFVLSQTFIPALLFVPGMSPIRTLTRVSAYGVATLAWITLVWAGRRPPGAEAFPARPWLVFCSVWLGLSILHPNSYSLLAASAQAALYITILSPVFWAPLALTSSRQIGRLMALLFLCNALSAFLGIAQVFRPETFNPPVIPLMNNIFNGENLMFVADDGRKVLRPCGLTDSPGAACGAGVVAALLGLCWALRPIAVWKRLASLGLAFLGVAVIYLTHVRTSLVMVGICLVALTGLFVFQRSYRQALLLVLSGAGLVVVLWPGRRARSATP